MFEVIFCLCLLKEALVFKPLNLALYLVFVLTAVEVIYAGFISVALPSDPFTFNTTL